MDVQSAFFEVLLIFNIIHELVTMTIVGGMIIRLEIIEREFIE